MRRGQLAERRRRSATESLLSIVLVLEALLVFFLTLVVFALDILSPALAFTFGAVVFLAMLGVGRLLRHSWALWLGWILQAVIIASGFLVPLMFFIGTGFAGLWTYCFVTGRRLDERNARFTPDASGADTSISPTSTDTPVNKPKENS